MPKEFESGSRYQGYAQTQGYDPIKPVDVTPILRENRKTEQQNLQRMLDQSMQVMRIKDQEEQNTIEQQNRIADLVVDTELSDLADFSQTLTNAITTYRDYRKDKDIEAGLNLAYTDGLPQDAVEQFKRDEAMAEQAATLSEGAAASLEAENAPTDLVQRTRNLSGWKGYGYARGIAQLGGEQYGIFYEEVAERVTVDIAGRAVTLANAKDSSERAAVEAEIRRQYLKNFEGMNLGLLNEYLFPGMRRYETQQATAFALEQREMLRAERETTAKDELSGFIKGERGGEGFIRLINTHQYDFGGRGKTREMFVQELKDGLASGRYSPEQVEALLEYQFDKNGTGKLISIQEAFARDFEEFPTLISQAKQKVYTDIETDRELRVKAFETDIQKKVEERGFPLNNAEIAQLRRHAVENNMGDPEFLKTMTTLNDLDKEASDDLAAMYIADKGFISQAEAAKLHPETTATYRQQGKITENDIAAPSQGDVDRAKDSIRGLGKTLLRAEGQLTAGDAETTFNQNAFDEYRRLYAAAAINPAVPEGQAHEYAMQELRKLINAPDGLDHYSKQQTVTLDQEKFKRYKEADAALTDRASIYQAIPALLPAVEQLREYQRRGKNDIPFEFHQLARSLNGIDGWDLAAAQYEAHGMKPPIKKPQIEQSIDGLSPSVRYLMRKHNTPSRTLRAQIESGDNMFLELVKNKESTSYGEYDAMNTGGAASGHIAYGSANSKDVFDKPLTQMTIGEVMSLQSQGKLHAAGAYQIIGKTLPGILSFAGLNETDMFDEANQDKLAIALYRRRVTWHGTTQGNLMNGLRNEWIGLQNVPDATLLEAMESMSPYNQPQNILPALRGGS